MHPHRHLLLAASVIALMALVVLWTAGAQDIAPPTPVAASQRLAANNSPTARSMVEAEVARDGRPSEIPIRVALQLVRSAELTYTSSDPPLGSRRSARLSGQLVGVRGEPILGEVKLVAGPNRGWSTTTDAIGRFAAVDLYPGLGVIEVLRDGKCIAHREVRLAASGKTRWHLAMASPARIVGRVLDTRGAVVHGAQVSVDGLTVLTDTSGGFVVDEVASGTTLLEVAAAGLATVRQRLSLAPSEHVSATQLAITMQDAARLQLTQPDDAAAAVRVWLLPVRSDRDASVPWDQFAELTLGSEPLLVTGLPAGPVNLFAHRPGGQFRGGMQRLELTAGATTDVELELHRTATFDGCVTLGGQPCPNAVVVACAPDPLASSAASMQLLPECFDQMVLPLLPPALESTVSDARGAFRLGCGDPTSLWRELRVFGPGAKYAMRQLWHADASIAVELSATEQSVGHLALDFLECRGELLVEVLVQGQPLAKRRASSCEPLIIDDLPRGIWNLNVSSGAVDLLQLPLLRLDAGQRHNVDLPIALRGVGEWTPKMLTAAADTTPCP